MLIETLPAAFEMDEILFELREHSAGLNCGRWDYIFSFIKTLRADPKAVMPDRCAVHCHVLCLYTFSSLCIVAMHAMHIAHVYAHISAIKPDSSHQAHSVQQLCIYRFGMLSQPTCTVSFATHCKTPN